MSKRRYTLYGLFVGMTCVAMAMAYARAIGWPVFICLLLSTLVPCAIWGAIVACAVRQCLPNDER